MHENGESSRAVMRTITTAFVPFSVDQRMDNIVIFTSDKRTILIKTRVAHRKKTWFYTEQAKENVTTQRAIRIGRQRIDLFIDRNDKSSYERKIFVTFIFIKLDLIRMELNSGPCVGLEHREKSNRSNHPRDTPIKPSRRVQDAVHISLARTTERYIELVPAGSLTATFIARATDIRSHVKTTVTAPALRRDDNDPTIQANVRELDQKPTHNLHGPCIQISRSHVEFSREKLK